MSDDGTARLVDDLTAALQAMADIQDPLARFHALGDTQKVLARFDGIARRLRHACIADMLRQGKGPTEIARATGVSVSTVKSVRQAVQAAERQAADARVVAGD